MDKAKEFFNKRAREFGYDLKTLDWSSKRTQFIRFQILSEIGNLKGKSILDVGCGFADLHHFLRTSEIDHNYKGVDISDEIIKVIKEKDKSLDVENLDIIKDKINQKFDFVFGSGIHYLKSEDNYLRFAQLAKKMFELANIGIATNFIRNNKMFEFADHVFTYEIEKVISIIDKITPFWQIRTDYLDNDVTVYLYKSDFSQRNKI